MIEVNLPSCAQPPMPQGCYCSVVIWRDLAFVAGHVSREHGQPMRGCLESPDDLAMGQAAARASARACLAALEAQVGSLDAIARVLSVRGFLVAAPQFEQHTRVLDAASEWLIDALGQRGQHARAVVGVASLPAGGLVEIELIAALQSNAFREAGPT